MASLGRLEYLIISSPAMAQTGRHAGTENQRGCAGYMVYDHRSIRSARRSRPIVPDEVIQVADGPGGLEGQGDLHFSGFAFRKSTFKTSFFRRSGK